MTNSKVFVPLGVAVLTISDSRDKASDTSGKFLLECVDKAGHKLHQRKIVKDDGYAIRDVVSKWIASSKCNVVITTGGTGVTARDGTPEAVGPLLDKTLSGFGELFRMLSYEEIGASTIQSRAIAGVANGTIIFVLPGSTGACRLAWDKIIAPQIDSRTKPCNFVSLIDRLVLE